MRSVISRVIKMLSTKLKSSLKS